MSQVQHKPWRQTHLSLNSVLSIETRNEEHEVIVTNVWQNPNYDDYNEKRAFQTTTYRDWTISP